MENLDKQRGMTAVSMLFIGILLGLVLLSAFKVYPAYYDDFAVSTALSNMKEEESKTAAMSSRDIRETIQKRISTSGVSLKKENVEILKEKGNVIINVNYERRTHLYGNIDAVMSFSHSISVRR